MLASNTKDFLLASNANDTCPLHSHSNLTRKICLKMYVVSIEHRSLDEELESPTIALKLCTSPHDINYL